MFTGVQLAKFILILCLYVRLNILHPMQGCRMHPASHLHLENHQGEVFVAQHSH